MPNLFLVWGRTPMFYSSVKKGILFKVTILLILATPALAQKVKVVAITQDFASIAKSVGGDLVDVVPLVKGSRNLHEIQPKPSMVLKLKKAKLLIRLGMSQDSWIDGLIQVAQNKALFEGGSGYLDCSAYIKPLEVPEGKIDGSKGDIHKEGNPHYWLNPENGKKIAQAIRDKLKIKLDNYLVLYPNEKLTTQTMINLLKNDQNCFERNNWIDRI